MKVGGMLNFGMFSIQFLNLAILLGWLVMSVICLVKLSKNKLSANSKAIWTLIILLIPLMGSIAYLIVKPDEENAG